MSAAREPTFQQREAFSRLQRNLLINAGAGSGKTWVLVERFVHLLAHPDDSGVTSVSQIVAITFTTKAAQEMRARVRERLNEQLAHAPDDAERTRWARHLKEMDGARISTIHALAAALLRANAAELGGQLDPAFQVLDEVQSRLLADAAVDEALRDMDLDDPALAVFADFAADAVIDELRAGVALTLPAMAEDLLAHWSAAQTALWERMRPGVAEALRAALAFEPPKGLPGADKRWLLWKEATAAVASLAEPDGDCWAALATLTRINLQGGSKKDWGLDAFNAAGECLRALRDRAKAVLDWLGEPVSTASDGLDARAAALVGCWHALICRAQDRYRKAKTALNALDFDDLERLALELLQQPDVAARYDAAEFRHVMVDEFQDTSDTQWALIQRLANPARPGALFLVGDPKQSIYGFRGADARGFERARATLLEHSGGVVPLATSFRTHRVLVEQCNVLFRSLLTRDAASPAAAFQTAFGDADLMSAHRDTLPGQLPAFEILLADRSERTDDEDTGRAREAQAIAGRIQALVQEGALYSDITLLFRATSAMPTYEEALKDAGIPYVTVAGRGYYSRQEVWDVLALLRAVVQPDDALSLATALRSPLFALRDDALLALRWAEPGQSSPDLWQSLQQAGAGAWSSFPPDQVQAAAFASQTLTTLREAAGRVPLAELIEQALDATGYRAVLSALPDGARRRGNLDKLVSKAAEAGSLSLGAFLQLLGDLTERETREGEAVVDAGNAVQLMTIHAAKGLEFPIVILADCGSKGGRSAAAALLSDETMGLCARLPGAGQKNPKQCFAWRAAEALRKAREEAELRRLLYVAATRAKERLIISSAFERNNKGGFSRLAGLLELVVHASDLSEFLPADEATLECTLFGGPARLTVTRTPRMPTADDGLAQWPTAPEPPTVPPALLAPVPADPRPFLRSLSATAVAELGFTHAHGRQDWRALALRGHALDLGPAAPASGGSWYERQLGEIVASCPALERPQRQ